MSDLMGKGEIFSAVWVDVENEGLPQIHGEFGVQISDSVLVHVSTSPGVSFGIFKIAYYDLSKKAWIGEGNVRIEKEGLVTHWMKLPKSPWQEHPTAGDKFKPASSL